MEQAVTILANINDGPGVPELTQEMLQSANYVRAGSDLVLHTSDGQEIVIDGYFQSNPPPALIADNGASLSGDTVSLLAGPEPVQLAQAGGTSQAAATVEQIGEVKTLSGTASVQRTDGTQVDLKVGTPVFQGDVVGVSQDGKLGITFEDGAVFSLSNGGTMVLDEMVYNAGGSSNKMLFTLVKGALGLVTGEIAGSGGVEVNTPSAVLAIRGTTVISFELPESVQNTPELGGFSQFIMCVECTNGPFEALFPNFPPIQVDENGTAVIVAAGGDQPPKIIPIPDSLRDDISNIVKNLKLTQVAELQDLLKTASANFLTELSESDIEDITGGDFDVTALLAALLNALENAPVLVEASVVQTSELLPADAPEISEIDAGIANEDDPDDVEIDLVAGQGDLLSVEEITSVESSNTSRIVLYSLNGSVITIDPNQFDDLRETQEETVTVTYTVINGGGPVTNTATFIVTGANDAPEISGVEVNPTGLVEQGTGVPGTSVVTGDVSGTWSDVDQGEAELLAVTQGSAGTDAQSALEFNAGTGDEAVVTGTYGSLFIKADGSYRYVLDNADADTQALNDGQSASDTFNYTVANGADAEDAATSTITVTITGTADGSVVSGDFSGEVTEGDVGDAPETATGSLSISDVDGNDSPSFADVATTTGDNSYGSFQLTEGVWTYTLDQAAVQNLDALDEVTDTITFTATDGTEQQITVTITGTADGPVVSGDFSGEVTEGDVGDAPETATGSLSISDVDGNDSPSFADVATTTGDNSYGSFQLTEGVWTYTLDQAAVQNLDALDEVTDTITFTATDGTEQQITVTITGTADGSVVSGDFSGEVTEGDVGDAPETATGSLSISDVDGNDSPSFADVATTTGDNSYGSFQLTEGVWTYTLDQAAVQDLDALDEVTDTITFTATDGTEQQITVTITGTADGSVVSGDFSGEVTEGDVGDAPETATGSLSISDVDGNDSPSFADVATTTGDNSYGSFQLTEGVWTYTLDQAAVQNLDALDEVTDTITFTATDGTEQQITVTITGTADGPVVSGDFSGEVTEGDVGDAPETATGSLSISDVDGNDSPSFADVATTTGDNSYGSFQLTEGVWTYTLDQAAVQNLDALDQVTDTITFTATDGTEQQITVTITGTADGPMVSGDFSGEVTEGDVGDAPETATGSLSISDVDGNDSPSFADVATTTGDNSYGSFQLTEGVWTYTLDQAAVQNLDALDQVTDTITFTATDGTEQQITVTITGTADGSVVSGDFSGEVTEGDVGDAPETATGSLSISDVDGNDSPSFADVATTAGDNEYGSFSLTEGVWTYTLDQSAVQDLDALDEVTDTITFTATDGTEQQITVTITGTADGPVVSGDFSGEVTEGDVGDAPETATGSLSISDVDGNDSPSFADVATTAGDNEYGSFSLTEGVWTYTLDQSAVQDLDALDEVTDTITFTATDGTEQQITVTITGTADGPVVSGDFSGEVTEGDVGDAPETATGSLSISDVDGNDSPSFADVATTAGDNEYGSFSLTEGVWTYTLDQSAVQKLDALDQVTDTITFTATDGAEQQITVTITGADDAAQIGDPTVAELTEDTNVDVDGYLTAVGAISISDADSNQSSFDTNVIGSDNNLGSLELQANGEYIYSVANSATQFLGTGQKSRR